MNSLLDTVKVESNDDEYDQIVADRHEILPGLWLGCHPEKLEPDLKYVMSLNGAKYSQGYPQYVVSTYFADSVKLPPPAYLHSLANTAIALWKEGPILIHCAAGLNRSGLIMGLVLVKNGMDPTSAINLMRSKRSNQVLHNPIFRNWLLTQ